MKKVAIVGASDCIVLRHGKAVVDPNGPLGAAFRPVELNKSNPRLGLWQHKFR